MTVPAPVEIRAIPQDRCIACGGEGRNLYSDLTDRLFGSPGHWCISKCVNEQCGLVWLNPMPVEEDISIAYKRYYTHLDESSPQIMQQQRSESGLIRWFSRVTGLERRANSAYFMYLDDMVPGKLLEIGCGGGQRLAQFQTRGWDVLGQDVDEQAAAAAKERYGLDVVVGPIYQHRLAKESFDAVVMNHVIEHLHDPAALLRHCHGLLRPGGVLSMVTPNAASLGHYVFKQDWRPLEPPRHLYIYTRQALVNLTSKSGFYSCNVRTSAINSAGTAIKGSLLNRRQSRGVTGPGSTTPIWLQCQLFRLMEMVTSLAGKDLGEECVAICRKKLG